MYPSLEQRHRNISAWVHLDLSFNDTQFFLEVFQTGVEHLDPAETQSVSACERKVRILSCLRQPKKDPAGLGGESGTGSRLALWYFTSSLTLAKSRPCLGHSLPICQRVGFGSPASFCPPLISPPWLQSRIFSVETRCLLEMRKWFGEKETPLMGVEVRL